MRNADVDLSVVQAGFDDPVHESQECFRQSLDALASPGTIVFCGERLKPPVGLDRATAALLLTLLDSDCSLWLSPGAQTVEIAAFLKFHTGCSFTEDQAVARFALVHDELELPRLRNFNWGSDEYPDQSVTVIAQVKRLQGSGSWYLSGPGIERSRSLNAGNLPLWFIADWAHVHASFPRGMEVFMCADNALAALARTTRLTLQAEPCTSQ